jgi:hypothetical protein
MNNYLGNKDNVETPHEGGHRQQGKEIPECFLEGKFGEDFVIG